MSYFGVSFKNNPEQTELARLIYENNKPIIFATGNAGTGKTFATLATALELVLVDKKYNKIIYGRNPVQVGESLGFLPGDVDEKYGPFMGPLYDNLESIVRISNSKEKSNSKQDNHYIQNRINDLLFSIEMTPIAFLRGRSIDNAIVIIDEAQNLDLTALKTILTRVGKWSKIILLGSMNQIDDPRQRKQEKCDFQKVMEALQDLSYVGSIELTKSMRSEWCVELDHLLSEIDRRDLK